VLPEAASVCKTGSMLYSPTASTEGKGRKRGGRMEGTLRTKGEMDEGINKKRWKKRKERAGRDQEIRGRRERKWRKGKGMRGNEGGLRHC